MDILKIGVHKLYKLPFKLYWLACKVLKTDSAFSIYKVKLTSNFSDQTFRFCLKGTYGYQYSSFLKNRKQPFIFLDIGANQGLYSLIAASNTQCRKAWAFEPVEKTYGILKKNISLNNLSAKVFPMPYAISDSNKDQSIGLRSNHSGGASLMDSQSSSQTETIHCMTALELNDLIDIVDNEQIIVKIDTEGYEPIVVAQLKQSKLWSRITHFYIEIDATRHAENDLVGFLIAEGFSEMLRTSSSMDHFDILLQR